MPTAIERGAVVEYPALFDFESYPRPYLIISGDDHPFYGEEYIGLAITTTDLPPAIPIPEEAWNRGGLPKPSFIKPWQPILLKHDDVVDAFGVISPSLVDRAVSRLVDVIND